MAKEKKETEKLEDSKEFKNFNELLGAILPNTPNKEKLINSKGVKTFEKNMVKMEKLDQIEKAKKAKKTPKK